ncbi:alpha/beta fold hydrolase [Myxococcota bacterium]
MLRQVACWYFWLVGLLVGACGPSEQDGPFAIPVGTAELGGEDYEVPFFEELRARPPEDLDWHRCPLLTGFDDEAAECATAQVPGDWHQPDEAQIELFVKRYRSSAAPRGQLWLLAGGPGSAGMAFEDQLIAAPGVASGPTFAEMAPDLVLYMLDHRGTGGSTRLSCETEEDPDSPGGLAITAEEWATCRETLGQVWGGDGLRHFSIEQSAQDLGALIQRTRRGDEPVFVYAFSYGTLWAQRYLQRFPSQSDGVVLDSLCAPGACEFGLKYDQGFHDTGRSLMAACALSTVCQRHLGSDPWGRLEALYAQLDQGHCAAAGIERSTLRNLLALMLTTWALRDYIPAVVARLERCDADDVEALLHLAVELFAAQSPEPSFSQVLNRHVILSEFMQSPPPSIEQAENHVAGLLFSLDAGPELVSLLLEDWPVYARETDHDELPATDVPLLMLAGELDPQAPSFVSEAARSHYRGPHQVFLSVPGAAHSVLRQSPLVRRESGQLSSQVQTDPDGTLRTCGEELIQQFLGQPRGSLDTDCLGEVRGPAFGGSTSGANVLFGSPSVWGG